ncbi:MAG TPA: lysine biosynthesis protein LysX, partial [Thermomicrobiales bacterium]|nr:lysine biosynthesis protein LysX [Thermomicrobiales bacterium]
GGGAVKLGMLVSHLRTEEKEILAAADARGIEVVRVFDREVYFDLGRRRFPAVDLVLDRSLVHSRAEYTLRLLQSWGIPTVNSFATTVLCDNKFHTNMAFIEHGVPTLRTLIAYTPESALAAIEELGYPVVLKPNTGSWGRLLAKINGRAAAEAVLEHKAVLGSFHHSIFYIQEYVEKPGRDIRAFVVGDRVVAASYRNAEHWITNTARGARSTHCPVTPEIEGLALRAARAVGGEVMGVDLIETDEGLKVIEINVGAEFHGLRETTDRNIAAEIVAYLEEQARRLGRDGAREAVAAAG